MRVDFVAMVGWLFAAGVCLLVCAPTSPCAAQATSQPEQLVFTPLPLDPYDFDQPWPIEARLRVYHLPDSRRGENYTVGGWVRIGSHHAFAWELAYAGIEDADGLQYGGGAPRWQWTTHVSGPGSGGVAFDVAVGIPVGDRQLHPLSTRAASVHGRLRYSPFGRGSWRLWLGFWGQGVSPPDPRDQPLASYPNGYGFDVALHGARSRVAWEAWAHALRGDLPENLWLEGSVVLWVVADAGLRLGATVTPGPQSQRLMDLGWHVGVTWRPSKVEGGGGDEGDRRGGAEALSRDFELRYP